MGSADWKRASITVVGLFLVALAVIFFTPPVSDRTSAEIQVLTSIIGIGLAIYVPYRQRKDSLEAQREDAIQQAKGIVKFLTQDFLSLYLQIAVSKRLAHDEDINAWCEGGPPINLHTLRINISDRFDKLLPEMVSADPREIQPLADLISAARYHNGIFENVSAKTNQLSLQDRATVIELMRGNLELARVESVKAWRHYFPDKAPPQA